MPCPMYIRLPFAALDMRLGPCQTIWVLPSVGPSLPLTASAALMYAPTPDGLNLWPSPCRCRGGSCIQFLASYTPPLCFLLTRS